MQLDQSFNKNAYIDDGRLDHAFMGAILDTLKVSQHLYKREDLAKLYHFIGDLFASGEFSWGGDVSFAPDDKKALTKNQKSGKVSKE